MDNFVMLKIMALFMRINHMQGVKTVNHRFAVTIKGVDYDVMSFVDFYLNRKRGYAKT